MEAHPRDKHYNSVKSTFWSFFMVFWNEATFVTYGWNRQDRKVQLKSTVVCDS